MLEYTNKAASNAGKELLEIQVAYINREQHLYSTQGKFIQTRCPARRAQKSTREIWKHSKCSAAI